MGRLSIKLASDADIKACILEWEKYQKRCTVPQEYVEHISKHKQLHYKKPAHGEFYDAIKAARELVHENYKRSEIDRNLKLGTYTLNRLQTRVERLHARLSKALEDLDQFQAHLQAKDQKPPKERMPKLEPQPRLSRAQWRKERDKEENARWDRIFEKHEDKNYYGIRSKIASSRTDD